MGVWHFNSCSAFYFDFYIDHDKYHNRSSHIQIQGYKKSKEFDIPETVTNIRDVITEFKLNIKEYDRLKELENIVKEIDYSRINAENESKKLRDEISILNTKIQSLQKPLTIPKTIELIRGESAALIENHYYLGLSEVHSTSVDINLNNDRKDMSVGHQFTFKLIDQTCIIILKSVKKLSNSATFLFNCNTT
jgi:hypothetical protein